MRGEVFSPLKLKKIPPNKKKLMDLRTISVRVKTDWMTGNRTVSTGVEAN